MKVRFWGTRGSIPVSLTAAQLRAKMAALLRGASGRELRDEAAIEAYLESRPFHEVGTYGGHSSCVEIETGGPEYVLCDMGSGLRPFGEAMIGRHGPGQPQTYHVFMSHLHWDHIMGLPFFTPAYIPGNRLVIYGCHERLREALVRQQDNPSFPVPFSYFGAGIEFVQMTPGVPVEAAGLRVTAKKQQHAGDSYGYRFEQLGEQAGAPGKTLIYTTDSEHKLDDVALTQGFVEFFRGADLVVFDAMYSLAEAISVKADWGHSSNIVGVELCQMAGVRHLCMFHHEPAFGDAAIDGVLADTRRYEEISRAGAPLRVTAAYDGLVIEL
ncbi:MAG TPA: MBL fold metallo-hydrolase [Burkholderiales bacterium]|nr:MBL fold metallo-hydrolase [Burkholderiales bacterium]